MPEREDDPMPDTQRKPDTERGARAGSNSKISRPPEISQTKWFDDIVRSNWAIVEQVQRFVQETHLASERAFSLARLGLINNIVIAFVMLGSWVGLYELVIKRRESVEHSLQQSLDRCERHLDDMEHPRPPR